MMRLMLKLIVVVAVLAAGWFFASPWLAMHGLANAAADRDLAALEQRVDFPALRDQARTGLGDAIELDRGNVVGAIAGAVVDNVGGAAIDLALTPRGVATLVESGSFVVSVLPERLRGQDISWAVERDGLNAFRGVGTFEDGTAGPVLLFERRGLGWQMIGVNLSNL